MDLARCDQRTLLRQGARVIHYSPASALLLTLLVVLILGPFVITGHILRCRRLQLTSPLDQLLLLVRGVVIAFRYRPVLVRKRIFIVVQSATGTVGTGRVTVATMTGDTAAGADGPTLMAAVFAL